MKNRKKVLTVLVFLMFILSMSMVVSAAVSKAFFTENIGGMKCTGRGTIDGNVCTAVLSATEIPLQPILPNDDYSCTVMVLAHSRDNRLMGATTTNGTTYASATYTAPREIYDTYCTFSFNGVDFGGYILRNK